MKISKSYYNGFARALDLGATAHKGSLILQVAPSVKDGIAIRKDWENVGKEIERGIKRYGFVENR